MLTSLQQNSLYAIITLGVGIAGFVALRLSGDRANDDLSTPDWYGLQFICEHAGLAILFSMLILMIGWNESDRPAEAAHQLVKGDWQVTSALLAFAIASLTIRNVGRYTSSIATPTPPAAPTMLVLLYFLPNIGVVSWLAINYAAGFSAPVFVALSALVFHAYCQFLVFIWKARRRR